MARAKLERMHTTSRGDAQCWDRRRDVHVRGKARALEQCETKS